MGPILGPIILHLRHGESLGNGVQPGAKCEPRPFNRNVLRHFKIDDFDYVSQISNYELGVVFLLKDAKEVDNIACFQRPPKKYMSSDEPWVCIAAGLVPKNLFHSKPCF